MNLLTPNTDRPLAGVLVPLFAIRGSRDLGVGDVRSLREFVDWCSESGFGLVNLLPLNEPGLDPSPYNPISAMAVDPLSISLAPDDLEDVTDLMFRDATSGVDLSALRKGAVRYAEVRTLKWQLLEKAFEAFTRNHLAAKSSRATDFGTFVSSEAEWLRPYALFRTLMQRLGHERWTEWPAEQRTARLAEEWLKTLPTVERESFEQRITFYSYVQWIAERQWTALHQYARERGVALMGDIPLGVNFYSADVFADPNLFDLTWSCGAPPDSMSVGSPQDIAPADPFRARWGQNWGFPLYNWERMRQDGLRWWRRRVSRLRALVDFFRIDHILGFYRVYAFPWRPEQNAAFIGLSEDAARARTGGHLPRFRPRGDETPEGREANREHGESLLRVLVEEAGAGALIGEDLGCVPDYVRPSLHRLGIAGYKVPIWEQGNEGMLIPGARYERLSVAIYVTHDHAPLRAQWREWARAIRRARRGGGNEAARDADAAVKSMRQLWQFAELPPSRNPPLNFTQSLHRALIAALLRANSWLVIFMITDLFARTERFNVPGAIGEANWTQRMHVPIHELNAQPQTAWMQTLLHQTGRGVGDHSHGPL